MIHICAFFLPAVPLLLLLAFLVLGRYPGHEAIVRLSNRIAGSRHRRSSAAASPAVLRPLASAASGGLLLAFALSGRAPPAAAST